MTELATLTDAAARALTDEVKADAARLWTKLLELYERGAHIALGYESWHAYCATEFDMGQSQAYRMLDAGRVLEHLDSPNGESLPSEGVARELARLLREAPEQILPTWELAVAEYGQPTAIQVREVVRRTSTKGSELLAGFDDLDDDEEVVDGEVIVPPDPRIVRVEAMVEGALTQLRAARDLDPVTALDIRREVARQLVTTGRMLAEAVG